MQTVRFEVRLTTQQLHDLLQWLARNLHPCDDPARGCALPAPAHGRTGIARRSQALFLRSKWTTSGAF
jgi:hypothetical protein